MSKISLKDLIFPTVMGLAVSAVAMFIVAIFSMGFATQEPAVVVPIILGGPALTLTTWLVLNATSCHVGNEKAEHSRTKPERWTSPLGKLFLLFCGSVLSLPLFIFVVVVENQFPGERMSDVFGPYYTHPYRSLSGIVLCLIGLVCSALMYRIVAMRPLAVGLLFGTSVLGLFLVIAK